MFANSKECKNEVEINNEYKAKSKFTFNYPWNHPSRELYNDEKGSSENYFSMFERDFYLDAIEAI